MSNYYNYDPFLDGFEGEEYRNKFNKKNKENIFKATETVINNAADILNNPRVTVDTAAQHSPRKITEEKKKKQYKQGLTNTGAAVSTFLPVSLMLNPQTPKEAKAAIILSLYGARTYLKEKSSPELKKIINTIEKLQIPTKTLYKNYQK